MLWIGLLFVHFYKNSWGFLKWTKILEPKYFNLKFSNLYFNHVKTCKSLSAKKKSQMLTSLHLCRGSASQSLAPFDSKHRRKFTTNTRTLPYNFESIQSVSIKLYVADVVVVAVSVLKLLACFFFCSDLKNSARWWRVLPLALLKVFGGWVRFGMVPVIFLP